jgi:hypothetical protein
MNTQRQWQPRSSRQLSEPLWTSLVTRIRGEFDEMPGLRLTVQQARALLGLSEPASSWVLERLVNDRFLTRTEQGEYMRRTSGV